MLTPGLAQQAVSRCFCFIIVELYYGKHCGQKATIHAKCPGHERLRSSHRLKLSLRCEEEC